MDHVGDSADQVDRIKHVDGLRAVRHGDCDLVAFPESDGLQRFRAVFDLLNQLPVGRGLSHKVKRDVIRILCGDLGDLVEHGTLEVFQIQRYVAHVIRPWPFRGNGFHCAS